MGTYLLLASSIRRVRSMRVCLCAGCLEHWAVPTQIPFTFDLIRVPSISEFMSECLCVVLLPAVCFSHLHNRKKIQQLSVSSNHMALFFNLFSLKGFCVVCVCVCVYPVCVCVCFHAFCLIALNGNAPEHPAHLIPHTDICDKINSVLVWAS